MGYWVGGGYHYVSGVFGRWRVPLSGVLGWWGVLSEILFSQDSEIAEIEEVIKKLKCEYEESEMKQKKLVEEKQECYQEHTRCEKDVEQVSARMVQLKVRRREST